MTVGNSKPIGIAYADPNFDTVYIGGVQLVAPSDVSLLTAVAGTATASKAVILDANKAVDVVRTASLRLGTSGSEVAVSASAAELNKVTGVPASVTVAVTTPGASGTCDVAMTFKDAAGNACAIPTWMPFYLSSVDGLALTAAITGITVADTPVGAVGVTATGQQGFVVTTAAGLASVKLNGTAATNYYLTFRGPGGRIFTTPALLTKA